MASINGNKVNNSILPNIEWMIQAGINPKTNLPYKFGDDYGLLKANIKKNFRIVDEQDAINSFEWSGLPEGLTGQELERLLYYYGQLCFFYLPATDQFIFAKYALEGSIDFYGRFNQIHPVPVSSGVSDEEKKQAKQQADYFSTLKLKVLKDVKLDEITYDDFVGSAVILRDYTPQLGQTIIPRQQLQEPILDIESDIPCYLRTALKNSTGVGAMRVNDQSAYSNVLAANDSLNRAALDGERLIPVIGTIDFQELTSGDALKAEEFLESLQAIDNLRLGFHGLDNGGLFQKKAHMLEQEEAMNAGKVKSTLQDRLFNRQFFASIVNSYTGLEISVRPKEAAINADMDMDGTIMEDNPEDTIPGYVGESEENA